MIIEAYKKADIAYRYYKLKWPEREYDKNAAKKQFMQDKNIDKEILNKVIDEIYKEQKKALK